jgi:hypothetical protein
MIFADFLCQAAATAGFPRPQFQSAQPDQTAQDRAGLATKFGLISHIIRVSGNDMLRTGLYPVVT